ncbi:MAG TPA: flagellar motor switch protein FliG [Ilumatobacter sp.]|nr:flagellar motor switch protein FliG [Ilumatobacter sp.]
MRKSTAVAEPPIDVAALEVAEPEPDVAAPSALPTSHLTGTQKAAIVLLKLGKDRSAKVMQLLSEREVTQVTAEIVQAQAVRREDADASLVEFAAMARANDQLASGGVERARDLLMAAVGEERANEILENLRVSFAKAPFEFLRKTDPRQVLNFLAGEHPQTVALVLAHMQPEQASMVLGGLDEETQRDVSIRIAKLEQTSPEVITQLETVLERRFGSSAAAQQMHRSDGLQTLVDILNRSDRATERSIFEGLEAFEEELADQVRSRMFVFEDIVSLDNRAVQLILRQVDTKELATALKGVREEVRDKIMVNMSERAAQNLGEEIALLGAVRMKTVEEAQGAIVRTIRALEETGQVVVTRGTEEFVT